MAGGGGPPHLRDAVVVGDDPDDVVERQQRVTLDLRVDVLALGAAGEQLDEVDVVGEWTGAGRVRPMALRAHQRRQRLEERLVVVEEQHVVAHVHQLRGRGHGEDGYEEREDGR